RALEGRGGDLLALEVLDEGARERPENAVAGVEGHAPFAPRSLERVLSEETAKRIPARVRGERDDGARSRLARGEEAHGSAETVAGQVERRRAGKLTRHRDQVVSIARDGRVLEAS